jgi:hypothetical protein
MSNSLVNEKTLLLQYIAPIFNAYVMVGLIVIGTIGNLLNIFVFIHLKTLLHMSIFVFLIDEFTGNLVLLWSSHFPRCILNIIVVDPLVGSIVHCKIRWLDLDIPLTCLCLTNIDCFLNTSRNA